jgi:hypothetical protein
MGKPNQAMQPIVYSRPLRGRLSTTADRQRWAPGHGKGKAESPELKRIEDA